MISEVYNMDCLDGMRKYPDNHFDLAIVDPPYGIDAPAKLITLSNRGGANSEEKIHPTQKPIKLYEWLLLNFANEGDKILESEINEFNDDFS